MKKTGDRPSLAAALRLNLRALRLLYRYYPQMVASGLVCTVWDALTPYVGIYLSALVIDELVGGRDVHRLVTLVITALAAAALIALGSALLKRWKNPQSCGQWLKTTHILTEKLLDTDYVNLDDSHTTELLSTIRQSDNGGGWGLRRVIGCCEDLCSSVFTMLGGLALTVSLFATKVPSGAGRLALLNNPLVVLCFVLMMIAVTFAAPMLGSKAGGYYAKYAGTHNLANRLFSFFGRVGVRDEIAADVRIYRQDRVCDKFTHNKDDVFSSDGFFARLARGPMGLYSAAGAAVSVIFTGLVYAFVCLKALAGRLAWVQSRGMWPRSQSSPAACPISSTLWEQCATTRRFWKKSSSTSTYRTACAGAVFPSQRTVKAIIG